MLVVGVVVSFLCAPVVGWESQSFIVCDKTYYPRVSGGDPSDWNDNSVTGIVFPVRRG